MTSSQTDADVILGKRIEKLLLISPFSSPLAIRVVEAQAGWAVLTMTVNRSAMNSHGSCHGGALWTLADMAFGAAGYYDGPILTVGSDLTFLRPASANLCLFASARQVSRKGNTGIFHIVLASRLDDPDQVVASGTFTGRWVRRAAPEPRSSA